MATWTVTITIEDGKQETSNLLLYLPYTGLAIVDAQDDPVQFAQAYALALDTVIEGAVTGIHLALSIDLPVGLDAADPDSDVEEGAWFSYGVAGGYAPFAHRIATFSETYIIEGTKVVDIADADVAALVELMVIPSEAAGDWGIAPSDSRGNDLVRLIDAKEKFTRSRG